MGFRLTGLTRAWVAAALVALPLAVLAQSASEDEARKLLEAEKSRLDASQKRSKELQADYDNLAAERERNNARLIETGKLIHQTEGRLLQIEGKLGELEAQEKHLRGTLAHRHAEISALLAAMQRMGRNPPPVMITRREDALAMVRSAMLLAQAFPELSEQALSLAQQLKDLANVMKSIRSEGDKLKVETSQLNNARTRLVALQEAKRQSLAERRQELDRVSEAASSHAKTVEELMARLDKEVAERTPLGAYEKEAAAAEAAPGADKRAAAVLAPSGDRVAMLSHGRFKPEIPFAQAKGMLQLPVQGRRAISFGEKTQYGTQSKGIVIQTRAGGQVVAPCDGWIVYAGEFRAYGQLLIINGGTGYHMLLAGMSQIDVQFGQFVLIGEPVGVMSAAAKSPQATKAQDSGPVLYIELRKDGRSIDPDPWWAQDASRKVQG